MRDDLFKPVGAVFQRRENLSFESQFYLESKRREFVKNGLGIKDDLKRACFVEIKKELQELNVTYRKSINASSGI
jgi:hypothetical protein